jgi:hypothetical protein
MRYNTLENREWTSKQMTAQFVVAVSIADIRHDPDPESELVTQALMNIPVVTGEIAGEWTHITLSDYSGWILASQLETPIVKGYCEGEGTCGVPLPYSVVVIVPHAPLYLNEEGEETQGDLYLSTVLPYIDLAHPQRLRVALPGNREGWLARKHVDVRSNSELFPKQPISAVISYAKQFLGVPYLWGGTSWCGIDCSGLTQLCYRMGGYILPRDAYQQHDALSQSIGREEQQPGDLFFFGREQITHVALALNKHEYIHAEGQNYNRVTVHSLDPHHPAYNSSLAEVVWALKRVV